MNIFWFHFNVVKNAQYYCDKHVIKIILEIAQILSTIQQTSERPISDARLYRKTHVNHPITKWCRRNSANYEYAANLGLELCREYTFRFGKIHKCQELLELLQMHRPAEITSSEKMTFPPLCMPEKYKIPGKVVKSYRNYFLSEKMRFATWRKRGAPSFVQRSANYNL